MFRWAELINSMCALESFCVLKGISEAGTGDLPLIALQGILDQADGIMAVASDLIEGSSITLLPAFIEVEVDGLHRIGLIELVEDDGFG